MELWVELIKLTKVLRRHYTALFKRDYKKVASTYCCWFGFKKFHFEELAQALRSIGEPIFGQSVKDISGGKLLKQLFDITEKFNVINSDNYTSSKNNGSS